MAIKQQHPVKWQVVKPQIQTDQITREIGEAHGVLVLLAKGSMFLKENLCIKLVNSTWF